MVISLTAPASTNSFNSRSFIAPLLLRKKLGLIRNGYPCPLTMLANEYFNQIGNTPMFSSRSDTYRFFDDWVDPQIQGCRFHSISQNTMHLQCNALCLPCNFFHLLLLIHGGVFA